MKIHKPRSLALDYHIFDGSDIDGHDVLSHFIALFDILNSFNTNVVQVSFKGPIISWGFRSTIGKHILFQSLTELIVTVPSVAPGEVSALISSGFFTTQLPNLVMFHIRGLNVSG